MIVILTPNIDKKSEAFIQTWNHLTSLPNVEAREHEVLGQFKTLTETG